MTRPSDLPLREGGAQRGGVQGTARGSAPKEIKDTHVTQYPEQGSKGEKHASLQSCLSFWAGAFASTPWGWLDMRCFLIRTERRTPKELASTLHVGMALEGSSKQLKTGWEQKVLRQNSDICVAIQSFSQRMQQTEVTSQKLIFTRLRQQSHPDVHPSGATRQCRGL